MYMSKASKFQTLTTNGSRSQPCQGAYTSAWFHLFAINRQPFSTYSQLAKVTRQRVQILRRVSGRGGKYVDILSATCDSEAVIVRL